MKIIDRLKEFAVAELENMDTVNIPKQIIPTDAKEGAVIIIEVIILKLKKKTKNY